MTQSKRPSLPPSTLASKYKRKDTVCAISRVWSTRRNVRGTQSARHYRKIDHGFPFADRRTPEMHHQEGDLHRSKAGCSVSLKIVGCRVVGKAVIFTCVWSIGFENTFLKKFWRKKISSNDTFWFSNFFTNAKALISIDFVRLTFKFIRTKIIQTSVN